MKTLIDHLHETYLKEMVAQNLDPSQATLAGFSRWASHYLNKHRPSSIGHACEMNYSITLQDGETVLISPPYGQHPDETRFKLEQLGKPQRELKAGDMAPGGQRAVSMSTVKHNTGGSLDDGAVQL